MAFFSAVIRRDSVSLIRFPLLSHVQIFWCEISPVCRLKYLYSCFSFHFCFQITLVLLIIVLLISLSLLFLLYSSSPHIDAFTLSSVLVSPLPPFLDTYNLSMSSLDMHRH